MKNILILSLITSLLAWASDVDHDNGWFSCRPSKQLVGLLAFSYFTAQALAHTLEDNCTVSPPAPYTFTYDETLGMAWWQIATGIWAVVTVSSNFFAPWYYWVKTQNKLADSLQQQIDEIKEINGKLAANKKYCDRVDKKLRKKLREKDQ